jgi:erythromycin esterase-like protein/predicted phosphoribosyltransferase
MIYRDRRHGGRELATLLGHYAARDDVLVLALPRGGVPVAFEVAQALHAPLDIFLVRKLGVPGHEELAMGAIASGDVRVLNRDIVRRLGIGAATIDVVAAREQTELQRREQLYRGDREAPAVAGKTVIVIDDGLATGSTMRAALLALRKLNPARLVVAAPVAAASTCDELEADADEVVCASTPEPFAGVGRWYDDFEQTTDDEVRALLAEAAPEPVVRKRAAPTSAKRGNGRPEDPDVAAVRSAAIPLHGTADDYDALLARVGDATLVLLGEASHGTHEFYRIRADITRRLIEEKGFTAVAVEGDWPDAYRVNRFVRGKGSDADADAALGGFQRFPSWMWRNTDVLAFVSWLREHNDGRADATDKAGFYGLDLYSLHGSVAAVLDYLDRTDAPAARRARYRYGCFDQFGEDVQAYGYAAIFDLTHSCEDQVVAQLMEMCQRGGQTDDRDDDDLFSAEQNARLVRNAEAYYRSMVRGREESWNLRDRHMMETLEALMQLRAPPHQPMKIVVWAHNSHLGDARATEMRARGELNLGQLVRERYAAQAVLVGFCTDHGTVTAATEWDDPAQFKRVQPGLPGSCEALCHAVGIPKFQLRLDDEKLASALAAPRLQRAIGVIYRPQTERQSHYFRTVLPQQFNWLIHIDATSALVPLEAGERWHAGEEPPEAYPSGL